MEDHGLDITLVSHNSYSIVVAIIALFSFTNEFIVNVRLPNVSIDVKIKHETVVNSYRSQATVS
jgi:hypothetical protein